MRNYTGYDNGSEMVNVVPSLGWLATDITPRWDSTMDLAMLRPNPKP